MDKIQQIKMNERKEKNETIKMIIKTIVCIPFIILCCLSLYFGFFKQPQKVKEEIAETHPMYEIILNAEEKANIAKTEEPRFKKIIGHPNNEAIIIVDMETKVQYLYIGRGYGGGFTILVDENGKPLLYEGE